MGGIPLDEIGAVGYGLALRAARRADRLAGERPGSGGEGRTPGGQVS